MTTRTCRAFQKEKDQLTVLHGPSSRELAELSRATFDRLATEYYDSSRHPTSSVFNTLSKHALFEIRTSFTQAGKYLEIGCGSGLLDSIVSKDLAVLTDISPEMIRLARERTDGRVRCEPMDAFEQRFPASSFAGAVALLADPFNHQRFYQETARSLVRGGILVVTLPSHAWATPLRRAVGFSAMETRFVIADGMEVVAPSLTMDVDSQLELFRNNGFSVKSHMQLSLHDVEGVPPSHHIELAAKIAGIPVGDIPLVDFYVAERV